MERARVGARAELSAAVVAASGARSSRCLVRARMENMQLARPQTETYELRD